MKSTADLICCHISTPPVAVKSEAPAKLFAEGISETTPAVDFAGTAGDFLPRNQKFNLQPS
jgi:hypothetical protein